MLPSYTSWFSTDDFPFEQSSIEDDCIVGTARGWGVNISPRELGHKLKITGINPNFQFFSIYENQNEEKQCDVFPKTLLDDDQFLAIRSQLTLSGFVYIKSAGRDLEAVCAPGLSEQDTIYSLGHLLDLVDLAATVEESLELLPGSQVPLQRIPGKDSIAEAKIQLKDDAQDFSESIDRHEPEIRSQLWRARRGIVFSKIRFWTILATVVLGLGAIAYHLLSPPSLPSASYEWHPELKKNRGRLIKFANNAALGEIDFDRERHPAYDPDGFYLSNIGIGRISRVFVSSPGR